MRKILFTIIILGLFTSARADYSAEAGDCPAGYQCNGDHATECPMGSYSPQGDMSCHDCPSGTTTHGTAYSESDCVPCTSGDLDCGGDSGSGGGDSGDDGILACYEEFELYGTCGAGCYRVRNTYVNTCVACPAGTYGEGLYACVICPDGTTSEPVSAGRGASYCTPITKCAAGQYLNDAGTCTTCEVGYYCPGDDEQHYCSDKYPASTPQQTPYYSDEPGATDCKKCPEVSNDYTDNLIRYWYYASENAMERFIHPDVNHCRITWKHSTPRGSFNFSCSYGSTGYITGRAGQKCMAGDSSQTEKVKCDAGYYVDTSNPVMQMYNSSHQWWTRSYQDMVETEWCLPAGVGYYSVADDFDHTACPAGTSTHTDTAASQSECESLCTAGATELHVGDYVFNIWPNSECASPAIRLGLPGGTCCVRLERNDGPGLNVDIDGTVYHTVN